MAQSRQLVLTLVVAAAMWRAAHGSQTPKFFSDDPILAMPEPVPVKVPLRRQVQPLFDMMHSKTVAGTPVPAAAVNTLGEVPDSEWFTNRHGRVRLSVRELQQCPISGDDPTRPFMVIGGKDDGIMPGLRMLDAKGREYFVKWDPIDNPELATASEVIVSRFLYAIGYNTPKNDIVELRLSDLRLDAQAKITLPNRRSREMNWKDIEGFIKQVPHNTGGLFRIVASRAVDGKAIGPFRYESTRLDDPNDIVPHQNRRDLRGLYVFSAWLNNTDMKAGNTLDTVVEENGNRFIRHYLIDFGSALGSDGDGAKDARLGNEFMLSTPAAMARQILTLGLAPKRWERVDFPKLPGTGNFEAQSFDPDNWKSNYPNPAFLSRLPDDDYWAAKQVMAFTDDDIRAIVETGRFSDPRSTNYMVAALAQRRDKIGQTFLSKILSLDHFRIENTELRFDDLAVRYGFLAPRRYQVQWFRFNNAEQKREAIGEPESPQLPVEMRQESVGSYFSATIDTPGGTLKPVSIYFRKEQAGYKVVGIDRAW